MQLIDKYYSKAKKIFNKLLGRIDIPENIKNSSEKKILHISDTPDCIYPFLFRLIGELKPDIIIHTGDVVDNVKLGTGSSIKSYVGSLREIVNFLEEKNDLDIYIIPGNHDSARVLEVETAHIKLLEEGSFINIEGIDIGLAHYPEKLPLESEINLFGHCKEIIKNKEKIFLNGLLNINIILLPSKQIYKLPYPLKTNNARKYRTGMFVQERRER